MAPRRAGDREVEGEAEDEPGARRRSRRRRCRPGRSPPATSLTTTGTMPAASTTTPEMPDADHLAEQERRRPDDGEQHLADAVGLLDGRARGHLHASASAAAGRAPVRPRTTAVRRFDVSTLTSTRRGAGDGQDLARSAPRTSPPAREARPRARPVAERLPRRADQRVVLAGLDDDRRSVAGHDGDVDGAVLHLDGGRWRSSGTVVTVIVASRPARPIGARSASGTARRRRRRRRRGSVPSSLRTSGSTTIAVEPDQERGRRSPSSVRRRNASRSSRPATRRVARSWLTSSPRPGGPRPAVTGPRPAPRATRRRRRGTARTGSATRPRSRVTGHVAAHGVERRRRRRPRRRAGGGSPRRRSPRPVAGPADPAGVDRHVHPEVAVGAARP